MPRLLSPTYPESPIQKLARMVANPDEALVPGDFADLANRPAIDKTLQRQSTCG